MAWTVPHNDALRLPDFLSWDTWPFEGDVRVKPLAAPVIPEPPRSGDPGGEPCVICAKPASAYIWENDNWRLGPPKERPGLPAVLLLDSRRHVDLADLSDAEAVELGTMIVRIERAIMSLGGIARVHVARYGDGCAHLHVWFLARPEGMLQFRGTLAALWDDCLPAVPEDQWNENLRQVAAALDA